MNRLSIQRPATRLSVGELRGRPVLGSNGKQFIVMAWRTPKEALKTVGHVGAVCIWPEWEWAWTEDVPVATGAFAASLPAISARGVKGARKSLARFLLPYGNDAWVVRESGFTSIHILRRVSGVPRPARRRQITDKEEVSIVEAWLDEGTPAAIRAGGDMPAWKVVEVLSRFRIRGTDEPSDLRVRRRAITALIARHGKLVTRDWKKTERLFKVRLHEDKPVRRVLRERRQRKGQGT